jgi:murein L,D-transpeptidase YafK
MKTILLSKNKVALVDDEDFEYLNQWKWSYINGYAARRPGGRWVRMHRLLMNTPANMETDHVNGNTLDNQKINLRICTSRQNKANQHKRSDNTSGYKGVNWHKENRCWVAHIHSKHLGVFKNIEDAARAYDAAAKEVYGEFAKPNFIQKIGEK